MKQPGLIVLFCLFCGYTANAQSGPSLTFSLDRAGPPRQFYSVRVDQVSGRGLYSSDPVASTGTAGSIGTAISIGPAEIKKLFAAVPLVRSHRCESHNKGIAQTGRKTLTFVSEGAPVECTYNYSNEDRVNVATALFEAIGETMQYGDRLAQKLRFDRLGLDAEMDNLQNALQEGRAVDVANIAPTLQAIASDEHVMERVQRKAVRLLGSAGGTPAQASDAVSANPSNER